MFQEILISSQQLKIILKYDKTKITAINKRWFKESQVEF